MNTRMESLDDWGLPVPRLRPRPELVPRASEAYRPFDVEERTELAVETLNGMFGWDKALLSDKVGPTFENLHDSLKAGHQRGDAAVETFPALWLVDEAGLTFSAVVRGHDKLTGPGGPAMPETAILWKVWRGRSADYLNRRLQGERLSSFGKMPVQALAMLLGGKVDSRGLHLCGKSWEEQQEGVGAMVSQYNGAHSRLSMEGLNPVDWMMIDGQCIVKGSEPLDTFTVSRFVQHARDVSYEDNKYGPSAFYSDSSPSRAMLHWASEAATVRGGVRFLVGPKPESLNS